MTTSVAFGCQKARAWTAVPKMARLCKGTLTMMKSSGEERRKGNGSKSVKLSCQNPSIKNEKSQETPCWRPGKGSILYLSYRSYLAGQAEEKNPDLQPARDRGQRTARGTGISPN
jgi:hypothetical protein